MVILITLWILLCREAFGESEMELFEASRGQLWVSTNGKIKEGQVCTTTIARIDCMCLPPMTYMKLLAYFF